VLKFTTGLLTLHALLQIMTEFVELDHRVRPNIESVFIFHTCSFCKTCTKVKIHFKG